MPLGALNAVGSSFLDQGTGALVKSSQATRAAGRRGRSVFLGKSHNLIIEWALPVQVFP